MAIFNADFYPTPEEIAAEMLDPLSLKGKIVLEPSAGSGNLVKAALEHGAEEVLAMEIEPELRAVLSLLPCSIIGHDWLEATSEQISHVDFIVMNPPFSADEDHILHAWQVAPPGCEIVSLCNWSILDPWRGTAKQRQIAHLVEDYGSKENLGECFASAERTTNVTVGMVRLTKPGAKPGCDEYDGFFLGPDDIEAQGAGIIAYRKSRDIVNRYVEACRLYDEQVKVATRLHSVLDGFFGKKLGLQITIEGQAASRNQFRKELQKEAWKYVFAEFLPMHMATSQLAKDINLFVEKQSRIPFTERNLYRMLQIVAGTHEQRMNKAIEAAVDTLTRYTKENRYGEEGWVTNSGYMLNQKFISGGLAETCFTPGVVKLAWGHRRTEIDDLIKALCFITGKSFDVMGKPENDKTNQYLPGVWYDWGFFKMKLFKKGTVHFVFKDKETWAMLNRRYAQIKGQALPADLR